MYFKSDRAPETAVFIFYDIEKKYIGYHSFSGETDSIYGYGKAGYFRCYVNADFDGQIYFSNNSPSGETDYSYKLTRVDRSSLNRYKLTVVNFGDSIFGNTQDHSSVSAYIQRISGHTVYNFGFGGTTMGKRDNAEWDKFSFYSLIDAICDGDLSAQEAALDSGVYMPNYFRSTLKAIKSVDFDNVDVITIAYGTNDYHENVPLGTEDFDVSHYAGAFQYAVKRLQETYPHIRIIAVTPILRLFEEGTSDTYDPCGNGTLTDFKNALTDTAVKMHIPVVNAYDEMALSPYNRDLYYQTDDGTHINERGRAMLASLISAKIEAVCADLTVTPPNKTYGE
jgi:lysophospholipase L1-like esterase